jgi:uncharacterized protein with HEPN domain
MIFKLICILKVKFRKHVTNTFQMHYSELKTHSSVRVRSQYINLNKRELWQLTKADIQISLDLFQHILQQIKEP